MKKEKTKFQQANLSAFERQKTMMTIENIKKREIDSKAFKISTKFRDSSFYYVHNNKNDWADK
jgi:hypothetical protein